jgi:hypothetical protein
VLVFTQLRPAWRGLEEAIRLYLPPVRIPGQADRRSGLMAIAVPG